MLRISRHSLPEGVLLRLEGKLLGPWVEELQAAIARECRNAGEPSTILLDLHAVSYVDPAGTILLRTLLAEGAQIPRRSPFVHALLDPEAL